jgi:hypothetical protein
MRIQTDGYGYRIEVYDDTAELLGESARSKGIDAACEFTRRMLANLEEAAEQPDMTAELAEMLSTPQITVHYEIVTAVGKRQANR